MQSHSTREPYFPQNLSDYAPWVAKRGLLAPYGECQCGCGQKTNIATKSDLHAGWAKGQPLRLVSHHFPPKFSTLAEHFWAFCVQGDPDACWEWQGTRLAFGHGVLRHKGESLLAHRVSFELRNGPIPDGLCALHDCPGGDNPACVNPAHLWLGTNADNAFDMWRKGRGRGTFDAGEGHPSAKLSDSDVKEIKSLRASGLLQREIAERYGVSRGTIGRVLQGIAWRHVE